MKFKEYLKEKNKMKDGFNFKTKKDQTGHSHMAKVDEHGNGKTTFTSGANDHTHKIHEWNTQPAKGHIHTLKTK